MAADSPHQRLDPLGRQLNVTARTVRTLLDGALAEAGVTFANWTVLSALAETGPRIQKDLATALGINGPSMVHRLDQLEAAGFATRSRSSADRRATLIELTTTGLALFDQVREVMQETEAQLVDGISPTDLATARAVLQQVAERARTLRNPPDVAGAG